MQKIAHTLWVHRVNVESGEFVEGDTVIAAVDPEWRKGATQGHSGTHMVHAALRQVLGPNAVQAGSLNRPGYLRFDFNWQGPLTEEQLGQVEEVTNQAVQADYEVHTFTEQLDKAKAMGALALFGERYPEIVRVVEIGGPFSLELCGAPMCTTRRRSARSRFSASRRSAPGCAGSRPTSGWNPSATWPRSVR
ncbi:alanyl-tRNA synthetase domain protein [Mycobacterium xenopi 3993]|nr:alanyl-tRNA synthetase domain protein [Mycobacterium xenopi 3993]